MGLQVGRVNHHGLFLPVISGETSHHLGEDALITPTLPTVVERLIGTVLLGRVTPS